MAKAFQAAAQETPVKKRQLRSHEPGPIYRKPYPSPGKGCYALLVMDDAIAALDGCEYLFLADIEELDINGLRLVIKEGRPVGRLTVEREAKGL